MRADSKEAVTTCCQGPAYSAQELPDLCMQIPTQSSHAGVPDGAAQPTAPLHGQETALLFQQALGAVKTHIAGGVPEGESGALFPAALPEAGHAPVGEARDGAPVPSAMPNLVQEFAPAQPAARKEIPGGFEAPDGTLFGQKISFAPHPDGGRGSSLPAVAELPAQPPASRVATRSDSGGNIPSTQGSWTSAAKHTGITETRVDDAAIRHAKGGRVEDLGALPLKDSAVKAPGPQAAENSQTGIAPLRVTPKNTPGGDAPAPAVSPPAGQPHANGMDQTPEVKAQGAVLVPNGPGPLANIAHVAVAAPAPADAGGGAQSPAKNPPASPRRDVSNAAMAKPPLHAEPRPAGATSQGHGVATPAEPSQVFRAHAPGGGHLAGTGLASPPAPASEIEQPAVRNAVLPLATNLPMQVAAVHAAPAQGAPMPDSPGRTAVHHAEPSLTHLPVKKGALHLGGQETHASPFSPPVRKRLTTEDPRPVETRVSAPTTAPTPTPTPNWAFPAWGTPPVTPSLSERAFLPDEGLPAEITVRDNRGGELALNRGEPSLPRPELTRHVLAQLTGAARMTADRPVELALSPEELGKVKLTMNTDGNAVSVAIMVERPETLDLLRRNIEILAREMRGVGFQDVSFSFSGSHPWGDGNAAGFSDEHTESARFDDALDGHVEQELARPAPATPGRGAGIDLRI